ncbi:MAG TPA: hypothetical protein VLI94_13555 [Solirubrobacterales bacterium]|nr:hypothetical protein [Solirubrobacterales bacterium]
MNRRAIAFAYAILGLLAIGGAFAPLASAHPLTAESYPARLFGEQTTQHVFTIEGGMTAKCPVAAFEGKITEATETFELNAEYHGSGESKCSAFGLGGIASISTNGCAYVLRPQSFVVEGEELEEEFLGTIEIKCPEGQKITITSGTCEIQIGSQKGLSPMAFMSSGSAISVMPRVKETLRYTKTKDGSGCPLTGTGEKTDGSYGGGATIAGSNPTTKAPIGLSIPVPGTAASLWSTFYPVSLLGSQEVEGEGEHVFTFENTSQLQCTVASFSQTGLFNIVKEVKLGAEYSGVETKCKALKLSNFGTVSMNGCKYRLRATSKIEEGKFAGEAAIDCPPAASILMKLGACEVQIGDQNSSGELINQRLGPVNFVNQKKAGADEVEVSFEFSEEITYVKKADPATCPFSGTGEKTDGSYVGTFTLRGQHPSEEGFPVEIFYGET